MSDIKLTISEIRESPFPSRVGRSGEKITEFNTLEVPTEFLNSINLKDLKPNDFKFPKARNQDLFDGDIFQQRGLFSEIGTTKDLNMNSPKKMTGFGNEKNPVVVVDDENGEEEKKEGSVDDTINLLRTFDTATKNISAIPFDYLGSPILYEKGI